VTELLYGFIVVLLLTVITRIAYLMGRDAAEQADYQTISSLRHDLRVARLEISRLRENTRRTPNGTFHE
jgi:hypothetical protein